MKIEICEQMVQSWLQHIKKCQVVQTNWMISPLRMPNDHPALPYVKWFMEDISKKLNEAIDAETKASFALSSACDIAENHAKEPSEEPEISSVELFDKMMNCFMALNKKEQAAMANIFGKSTAHQFVTQCEIDVVGVKLYDEENNPEQVVVEKIYLIDSAFHKGTLGYGDVVARVLKKIIRACVVSQLVFGTRYAVEIAFATPDCAPGYTQKIADLVDILRDLLKKYYSPKYDNIEIKLYFNKDFADQIYTPLKDHIDALNNDNDLFMRSLNLAKVAEERISGKKKKSSIAKKVPTAPAPGGKKSLTSGVSGRGRYTDDDKYKEAAYYLWTGAKLQEIEYVCLGVDNKGSTAKAHLNKLGVDTSPSSPHKGLLSSVNIDDAIAGATDATLKLTLEEIKKRGFDSTWIKSYI